MAGSALSSAISAPLKGNLIPLRMWSGTRTTRCASRGSTFTKPVITLSSLNSCARAGREAIISAPSKTGVSAMGVAESRLMGGFACRWVKKNYYVFLGPAGSIVAPGRPAVLLILAVVAVRGVREPRIVVRAALVGIGRAGQFADAHELLHAPAADGLAGEHVVPGVDGHRVQEGEVTGHVAGAAEADEDRVGIATQSGPAVHLPEDFVPAVHVEEEGLVLVRREVEVPCGPDASRHGSGARLDGDDASVVAELVEDLDAIVGPIAGVDAPGLVEDDAVRMPAARGRELAGAGARRAPLAQVAAGLVEDDHPVIPVAVRDVDVAVRRIHRHVRRLVQQRLAGVRAGGFATRPVTHAPHPDRHLPDAAMRVLLDDSVFIAGDPDVVLEIDEAAVQAVRQEFEVAPGVHHVPVAVELDDRRRRLPHDRLFRRQVSRRSAGGTAVDREEVIVRVEAGSRDLAGDPPIRKRFRPERIDLVSRGPVVLVRPRLERFPEPESEGESSRDGSQVDDAPLQLAKVPDLHATFPFLGMVLDSPPSRSQP